MTSMLDEDLELDYATGGIAADEQVRAEAAARQARRGGANWFGLKDDGDVAVLRFLTPESDWIQVKQHDFVKTKAAPRGKPSDRDWPTSVGAICRFTPLGPPGNRRPAFNDCYVCSNIKDERGRKTLPSDKIWALAAARLSVVGTEELVAQGRIHPSQLNQKVVIDDAELIDGFDENNNPTGKVWRKKIWIVNQSVRNFYGPLTTIAKLVGSVTDRDFYIVRKGAKGSMKIDYDVVDLGSYPVTVPKLDGSGDETIVYDTVDPRIAKLYDGHGPTYDDIRKMINRRISARHYGFYFDERVNITWADYYASNEADRPASGPAAPSAAQQAGHVATAEPTDGEVKAKLEAMRAQVMASYGPASASSSPTFSSAPPPLPSA